MGFCFHSNQEVKDFTRKCRKEDKTNLMLNRLKWFVELSDFQKYDSVKIFFLIAMAETNIKLLEDRFPENSNETSDVEKFFDGFSKEDKDELQKYFFVEDEFFNKKTFEFKKIVNILLNVRHLLVHGKNHYNFRFHNGSDELFNLIHGEIGPKNKKEEIEYELEIKYDNFRRLMIKNAIENIKGCF